MRYFDFAATAPMSPLAIKGYAEAAAGIIGNASSLHDEGSRAADLLDWSRCTVAKAFHVSDKSVIFTSGGSESNQLAIQTLLSNIDKGKNHIIASRLEHASILQELDYLSSQGYQIDFLRHHEDGSVDLTHLQKLVNEKTGLAVIQHANSEIGIIQPLEQIAAITKKNNCLLHIDCVQSFGKISCREAAAYGDSLAVSSHKLHGPKGVGALILPSSRTIHPARTGISHESGYRAGTANVPGIYSFALAVQESHDLLEENCAHVQRLRSFCQQTICRHSTAFEVIQGQRQLPHILCLFSSDLAGQYVMMELNRRGYYISSGSACQSGSKSPSKAMLAIGKNEDEARGSIRISLSKQHTLEDCSGLMRTLMTIVHT
ncbi:cysteine desulfurase family protein [Bacillus sp. 1P06AnD]|uniref:cysteine desulfurase family protein n=1 Tax=Bacillus sp. 1P06AnD TaxID=3132208 RepID=UPI0039A21B87